MAGTGSALKTASDWGQIGLQAGGATGNPAIAGGLGAAGALAGGIYGAVHETAQEAYLKARIREMELKEAGLTDEEMSVYRESINAPTNEARAADDVKFQAARAGQDVSSGDFLRKMQEEERIKANQYQKTELGLMGADLQAKAEHERELERLYKEQAGLEVDPTESMLSFASEIEYQATGAGEQAAMQEAMLNFLQGEGMDGTPAEKKELMGFWASLVDMGSR